MGFFSAINVPVKSDSTPQIGKNLEISHSELQHLCVSETKALQKALKNICMSVRRQRYQLRYAAKGRTVQKYQHRALVWYNHIPVLSFLSLSSADAAGLVSDISAPCH